jgi:hypothetical protein
VDVMVLVVVAVVVDRMIVLMVEVTVVVDGAAVDESWDSRDWIWLP